MSQAGMQDEVLQSTVDLHVGKRIVAARDYNGSAPILRRGGSYTVSRIRNDTLINIEEDNGHNDWHVNWFLRDPLPTFCTGSLK
jgi:hypothetical protein